MPEICLRNSNSFRKPKVSISIGRAIALQLFLSINIFQPSLKLMLNFDYSEWVTVIFFCTNAWYNFLGKPCIIQNFFLGMKIIAKLKCNFDFSATLVSVDQTTYHLYVKIYFEKLYLCPNSNLFIYICISSIGLFFSFSRYNCSL